MKHSLHLSRALRLLLGVMLALPVLSAPKTVRAVGNFGQPLISK